MDNYMTGKAFHNDLESSLSITERSGKFIQNIYIELLRIIKPLEVEHWSNEFKLRTAFGSAQESDESPRAFTIENEMSEKNLLQMVNRATTKKGKVKHADMRHILGFLNQSEWIQSLNIGNIMQITPLQLEDFVAIRRNE